MTQIIALAFATLIAMCAFHGLCNLDDNDNLELEALIEQLE